VFAAFHPDEFRLHLPDAALESFDIRLDRGFVTGLAVDVLDDAGKLALKGGEHGGRGVERGDFRPRPLQQGAFRDMAGAAAEIENSLRRPIASERGARNQFTGDFPLDLRGSVISSRRCIESADYGKL